MPAVLHRLKTRLSQSAFVQSVGTLASGAIAVQIIGMASAPILTRLYEPTDYARVALFLAVVSIIAPAAAGRYDAAIVVASNDKESATLLALSILMSALISFAVLLTWIFGSKPMLSLLQGSSLGSWWWAVPAMLFLTTVGTCLRAYANRCEHYRLISRASIGQQLVTTAVSITLGLVGLRHDGQFLGAFVGVTVLTVGLCYVYRSTLLTLALSGNRDLPAVASRYREFPLFAAPGTLVNCLTLSLPVLVLSKYFPPGDVGQYALGVRVFTLPLSFLAVSVSQVHMRKIATLMATHPAQIGRLTHRLALTLLALACGVAMPLWLYGDRLFALAFGPSWEAAGTYISVLLPALVVRFPVSAISNVFPATGHAGVLSAWQGLSLFGTVTAAYIGVMLGSTIHFLRCLVVADVVLYGILYLAVIYCVNDVKGLRKSRPTEG